MSKIAHDNVTVVARLTPSIALSDMVDVADTMQKTSSIPALMERTIIIGAGMAGLVAAHVASKFSREVIVLEKDAIDLEKANVEVRPRHVPRPLCHSLKGNNSKWLYVR